MTLFFGSKFYDQLLIKVHLTYIHNVKIASIRAWIRGNRISYILVEIALLIPSEVYTNVAIEQNIIYVGLYTSG